MPELTVEVKATDMDVVKEILKELQYLRYFYSINPIDCARMDSQFTIDNVKYEFSRIFGEIPKGYQ